MVDWTQPTLSTQYAQVLTDLNDRLDANATMDFTGDTNIPTNAIRLDGNNIERYDGAAWQNFILQINNNDVLHTGGGQTINGTLSITGITDVGSRLDINGDGVGTANNAICRFYESDGSTRQGYVGIGSNGDSNVYLTADGGDVNLYPSTGIVYLWSGSTWERVLHSGGDQTIDNANNKINKLVSLYNNGSVTNAWYRICTLTISSDFRATTGSVLLIGGNDYPGVVQIDFGIRRTTGGAIETSVSFAKVANRTEGTTGTTWIVDPTTDLKWIQDSSGVYELWAKKNGSYRAAELWQLGKNEHSDLNSLTWNGGTSGAADYLTSEPTGSLANIYGTGMPSHAEIIHSGGGQFVSSLRFGTDSASNELDDYEEGTWTPNLGGNETGTYSGTYTKIGNLVYVTARISVTTLGTGSQISISGLPFTSNSSDPRSGGYMNYYSGLANSVVQVTPYIVTSSTQIHLYNATSASTAVTNGAIITSSTAFYLSAFYRI